MTTTEQPAGTEPTTPEGTGTAPGSTESAAETTATPEEGGGRNKALRERAQAAEERVAALEATLATYRQRDVEAMVGGTDGLTSPGDLWTAHELTEFIGDDGAIDEDAVSAAVEALRTERPHWFARRRPAPDRSQGSSAAGAASRSSTGETWQKVLSGGR